MISTFYAMRHLLVVSALLLLVGCGSGTKLLKDVEPLKLEWPLAVGSNDHLVVMLDWVIVRNGPAAWARNADWDEYLIRLNNQSSHTIRIIDVSVVNSLGVSYSAGSDRKKLIAGTKQVSKLYEDANIKVKAGIGGGALVASAVGAGATGVVAASYFFGAGFAGGSSAAGAGFVVASGMVLAAPVVLAVGVSRGVNNSKVAREIIARHAELPLQVAPGQGVKLDLFYPFEPSPQQIVISYIGADSDEKLLVDISDALNGLHLVPTKDRKIQK